MSTAPAELKVDRTKAKRAALAGGVGTLIEYYDFGVYGFLSIYIAPLFFVSENPAVPLLATLAVFGVAYVARPFGGIFFGTLGDKVGRKAALVLSVILMGIASSVLGLVPTYAAVGVLAPILLVLIRLLQGFSAGGEVGGSATYIAESAPPNRRGMFGSFTPIGSTLGFSVAAAVVGLTTLIVGADNMATWGWRIPFLVSILLTAVCLVIRLKLEDTDTVRKLEATDQKASNPFWTVVKNHPLAVLRVVGLAIATNGTGYVGLTYFSVYLINDVGYTPQTIHWISALGIALACVTYPLSGLWSDIVGRKKVFAAGCIGYLVLTYPMLYILGHGNSLIVVLLVYVVYIGLNGVLQVPAFPLFTELFPGKVRYSGVALGFNVGTIVAGGSAPYIAAQLVTSTGDPMSPAIWVIGVAIVGLATALTIKETSKMELPK